MIMYMIAMHSEGVYVSAADLFKPIVSGAITRGGRRAREQHMAMDYLGRYLLPMWRDGA